MIDTTNGQHLERAAIAFAFVAIFSLILFEVISTAKARAEYSRMTPQEWIRIGTEDQP